MKCWGNRRESVGKKRIWGGRVGFYREGVVKRDNFARVGVLIVKEEVLIATPFRPKLSHISKLTPSLC